MHIERSIYGKGPGGQNVERFTLRNDGGLQLTLTNFGAILAGLEVPDRRGHMAEVTLGYGSLDGWVADKSYLGATVGRFGNRIARGRFTLDGAAYALATNDGVNHLHGGIHAFHKAIWTTLDAKKTSDMAGVTFGYVSADGEEGYPGTLSVQATYALTNRDELQATFTATTDKATVVNIVQHAYWNLTGDAKNTVLGHELTLLADRYIPVDGQIPTGERRPVAGTPMDFTSPSVIGARIDQVPGGYDHCWVLGEKGGELRPAAVLFDPASGRRMELATDQPGIQFYSGNFLDGGITGRGGIAYRKHSGMCLETQAWPDAPNWPDFPSCVLRP